MSRPLWLNKLLTWSFPQFWMVASATNWPGVGRWLHNWLFKDDALYMVPLQKIAINLSVAAPEQVCLPWQAVEHFIRAASFHFVMNECICRAGKKCKDYPIELGCIFLGESAKQINPEVGRRVSMEQALEHARKCRDAGLFHLLGRNRIDQVWLNTGPCGRLLTICNCCPCCCLWNNLPRLSEDIRQKITKMPGISVRVNDNCNGCGKCAEKVCFAGALRMDNGRAVISDMCRGCGHCALICDQQAIEITINNPDIISQSIQRISAAVNVK